MPESRKRKIDKKTKKNKRYVKNKGNRILKERHEQMMNLMNKGFVPSIEE